MAGRQFYASAIVAACGICDACAQSHARDCLSFHADAQTEQCASTCRDCAQNCQMAKMPPKEFRLSDVTASSLAFEHRNKTVFHRLGIARLRLLARQPSEEGGKVFMACGGLNDRFVGSESVHASAYVDQTVKAILPGRLSKALWLMPGRRLSRFTSAIP